MITFSETIESLLKPYASKLGKDFDGYRNHLYRVINFCHLFKEFTQTEKEQLEIAAVFHDLAIWTDKTANYVEASEELAHNYLNAIDFSEWSESVCRIIRNHQKLTRCDKELTLAEVFRRADWVDVTLGVRNFGLTRHQIKEIQQQFPDQGFHPLLAKVIRQHAIQHPFNPLPMFKW
jgi:hypothetical protein